MGMKQSELLELLVFWHCNSLNSSTTPQTNWKCDWMVSITHIYRSVAPGGQTIFIIIIIVVVIIINYTPSLPSTLLCTSQSHTSKYKCTHIYWLTMDHNLSWKNDHDPPAISPNMQQSDYGVNSMHCADKYCLCFIYVSRKTSANPRFQHSPYSKI